MRVCQLKLTHFRNYRELDLQPGAGLNIFHGANAQGKSNILEALWLLATTRSLRASRESELILRDTEMAHVTAEIDRDREGDVELQVSVFHGENKKTVRVNGMKRDRIIDLLGQFNAVFFGALDLNIVTGEPSDRRHYLNLAISQISPRYVVNLGHYKRVLQQRNRLLRDLRDRPRPPSDLGLDIWTEQLVQYGAPLLDTRRFYVERLMPLAAQIHRELTDGSETLEIRYLPSFALPAPALPPKVKKPDGKDQKADGQAENQTGAGNGEQGIESQLVRERSAEDRYLAVAAREAKAEQSAMAAASSAFGNREIGNREDSKGTSDESSRGRNEERGEERSKVKIAGGTSTPEEAESALSATERVANAFRAALLAVGLEEARRGVTLVGPQRDDLCFYINGVDARIYGSQGQQRTVALSLKLAEFRLIEEYVGEPPTLLLDDVMSDLDDSRRQHLLQWIRGCGQTFITCTNLRAFPADILAEAVTYQVAAGTITPDARPAIKPSDIEPNSSLETRSVTTIASETQIATETQSGEQRTEFTEVTEAISTPESVGAASQPLPENAEDESSRGSTGRETRTAAKPGRKSRSKTGDQTSEPKTQSSDLETVAIT